jgi:hypothetical protein
MLRSTLRLAALSIGLAATPLSASPLGPPLDPGLTGLSAPTREAAHADYLARLEESRGALTLVPVEAWEPERPVVLLVMGRGMTWTDLHAIVEMRDDYQLLVACYDARRPLREAADQLARALVELGQERQGLERSWRMVAHSYGSGVLTLALDRLRRAGMTPTGPSPAFDAGLAILMEAPWRGADLPWVVRVPGVQRAVAWVARRFFGRHDADAGGQSTFNHSPSMHELRAAGVPEGVAVELVTSREGLEPGSKWRHYEPTANWYPEELERGELDRLLAYLASNAEDPRRLRQWTVPLWNKKRGLLDQDAAGRLPVLRAELADLEALGGNRAARVAVYLRGLGEIVDTFRGPHTEFMWEDPRFLPWLRERLDQPLEETRPGDV